MKETSLYKNFHELFPYYARNNFVLEFIDYTIDPPDILLKNVFREV